VIHSIAERSRAERSLAQRSKAQHRDFRVMISFLEKVKRINVTRAEAGAEESWFKELTELKQKHLMEERESERAYQQKIEANWCNTYNVRRVSRQRDNSLRKKVIHRQRRESDFAKRQHTRVSKFPENS
jgi:transketolase